MAFIFLSNIQSDHNGLLLFVCFWTLCFALSFSFFLSFPFFFFSLNPCLWSLLFSWEQATTTDCSPAFWSRLSGHVVKCHFFTQKAHYSVSFTSITDLSVCLPGICILEGHIALSIPCTIVNQEMCVLLLGLCSLSFAFTGRFWRFLSLMFAHLLLLFSLFY